MSNSQVFESKKHISLKELQTPFKMLILNAQTLATIFGIIGNAVAVGVFLSPAPTFYKIYKRKSSEGYKSLPYAVALFSAMLLLYYGSLKPDGILIITINSFGCFIEIIYLVIFLVYAPKQTKIFTLKLILVFNLGACSLVMLLTTLLANGSKRITIVGWINAIISVCVFAAPLSIMKQVVTTGSVEFMPITLSIALTLNATMWFFYGFFLRDYFIAGPNVLGFFLGMIQMTLYVVYKWCISKTVQDSTQDETIRDSNLEPLDDVSRDREQIEMNNV